MISNGKKYKILLSAFGCRPNAGSEWGVGWNFFIRLYKLHDVHLITEAEYQEEIISECESLKISLKNIHFVDIGEKGRKKLHNQGDWTFYFYYHQWQKKALQYSRKLHSRHTFDLVHHLNMIGFREPGLLYKLGIPFVLGPLGGFGGVPSDYFPNKYGRQHIKNIVKNSLNFLSLYLPYVRRAIKNADEVIAAYPEAASKIKHAFDIDPKIIPETGSVDLIDSFRERKNVIWIGKNLFRKQFSLAAEAFLRSKLSKSEKLIVIGDFGKNDIQKWSSHPNILFLGQLSYKEVLLNLASARVLLFSSVHEGNPFVVYEAISTCTPVICHDSYGMGLAVDKTIGVKIPVLSFQSSVEKFSTAIDKVCSMEFCSDDFRRIQEINSWDERVSKIDYIYNEVLDKLSESKS